jgi:hypothetical protein
MEGWLGDMPKEESERIILALEALQRATSTIRFIQERDASNSEWLRISPSIAGELKKATEYLGS